MLQQEVVKMDADIESVKSIMERQHSGGRKKSLTARHENTTGCTVSRVPSLPQIDEKQEELGEDKRSSPLQVFERLAAVREPVCKRSRSELQLKASIFSKLPPQSRNLN